MLRILGIWGFAAILVNIFIFEFNGIAVAAEKWEWVHKLPLLLVMFVSIGITTEAGLNGLHSAREHWDTLGKRLLVLLTLALALRGAAIYLVCKVLFDLEYSGLIASGLTATDPAATGIALTLSKGNKVANAAAPVVQSMSPLFWMLAVESMLNDAEGLLLFEVAKGTSFTDIALILGRTAVFTLALAFTSAGARWSIRFWVFDWKLLQPHSRLEPYVETCINFAIYSIFIFWIGGELTLALIGMVAVAAIIADRILHKFQQEVDYTNHEHVREVLNDFWNNWGLSLVFGTVLAFMPFREIFWDFKIIGYSLAILAAIIVARSAFEFSSVMYPETKWVSQKSWFEAWVSTFASVCLLGVPSIVGFEMYLEGHTHDALVVLSAVMFSWFSVPFTVWLIQYAERKLADVKTQPLIVVA